MSIAIASASSRSAGCWACRASAYYHRATGDRSVRAVQDERLLDIIRVTHTNNFEALYPRFARRPQTSMTPPPGSSASTTPTSGSSASSASRSASRAALTDCFDIRINATVANNDYLVLRTKDWPWP